MLRAITEALYLGGHRRNWQIVANRDSGSHWIQLAHPDASTPQQGWKLHLSACETSALEVLARSLPVLLAEPISFKVAASLGCLNDLNEGHGGMSQVGKFITVYPNDNRQALRLAEALDRATSGLRGPRIPSDRALRQGGVVHYRYGGFADLFMQTPMGQIVTAIRTPDGRLVPDERKPRDCTPDWIEDPFRTAGLAEGETARARLVGERYLVVATLHKSPRGTILSAIDVLDPGLCLIKHAERNALIGPDGRDAFDRLRCERDVLERLSGDDRFPRVLGFFEAGDEAHLVMTELTGETIERIVRSRSVQGILTPHRQIVSWGRQLAAALSEIHRAGLVYRDLKSPNIIIGEGDRLHLVDFEMAAEVGAPVFEGRGTRGYLSPQQEQGCPPSIADDLYGAGALLYFIATAAEPSLAPKPFDLLERPPLRMNPDLYPAIADIIARCLDPDPARRFESAAGLEEALAKAARPAPRPRPPTLALAGENDEQEARAVAEALGDTICEAASLDHDGGLIWLTRHETREGMPARDLGVGSAGAVLVLSDLVAQLGRARHRRVLERGAYGLARSPGLTEWPPLPGLYVGEAGVGAALLRAGIALGNAELVGRALECGRRVASMPHASPDLYNGTAGRLRFHLWLWDETEDREQLRFATEAGLVLAGAVEAASGDWIIPPGYGGLSGSAYLGYAHGAAGIADALLDLFEAGGDEIFASVARNAADWIARHSFESLSDESGLDWPDMPDGVAIGPFWCHGAAGIGQFFLHAAQLDLAPQAETLARRAAKSAGRARWSGPTQCHGLAGNIELLLDLFQATGEHAFLDEARLLASLLKSFSREFRGHVAWSSESPSVVTPDYAVGYAGVAACFLRLADPKRIPRQLSRDGFRHCARLSGGAPGSAGSSGHRTSIP